MCVLSMCEHVCTSVCDKSMRVYVCAEPVYNMCTHANRVTCVLGLCCVYTCVGRVRVCAKSVCTRVCQVCVWSSMLGMCVCAERACARVLITCACDYRVTCVCVCAHVCAGCVRVCAERVVPTCPCLNSPVCGPMSNWELLASGRLWL